MQLTDFKKVHIIGVGGIGISGLARLFLHEGKEVWGSDRAASLITDALVEEGVVFSDSRGAHNITDDIDLVVYTEAIPEGDTEREAASEKGIPMMNYFEALGMVANEYYLIAITGTHGKSTTTAMAIDVLEAASLDPTAIVGTLRSKTKSNFRPGKSKYFVVEACEYRRDFLSLTPDVLAITNIEAEHLDYYKDFDDVKTSFGEFVTQVRDGGLVIADLKDPVAKEVVESATVSVVDYNEYLDPMLGLKVPGLHQLQNAAIAKAIADRLSIDSSAATTALENFAGTWRRFEYKGEMETGALVYDDYAHHPTEIQATINSVRDLYPGKKLTIVFEPHLASRTEELFEDFIEALSRADRVLLLPIYDARKVESEHGASVTSEQLVDVIEDRIRKGEANATESHLKLSFDSVVTYLTENTTNDDVVFIMGAGPITQVATHLTS